MKTCPKCSRVYADDALNFCLDDGEWLVDTKLQNESATAILSESNDGITAASENRLYDSALGTLPQSEATRPGRKTNIIPIVLAVAIGAVIVAAVAYAGFRYFATNSRRAPSSSTKFTRLTTTGHATLAAISPDGRYVVYASEDGGQQSLWMRQTATQSSVEIVTPASVRYQRLIFSPDANYLFYVTRANDVAPTLYQIPVLGHTPPKKLLSNVGYMALSPDATQIVFERDMPAEGAQALILSNIDGTAERRLAVAKEPERIFYGGSGPRAPAWSPDGHTLACPVTETVGGVLSSVVVAIDVSSGQERPIGSQRFFAVRQVAWLSDGSGLVVLAIDESDASQTVGPGRAQLWLLSYPEGEARRITNDLNGYASVSLTADSNSLVTVQSERTASIWVAPQADAARAKQLTNGSGRLDFNVRWTPTDKILFDSNASGQAGIWIMDADGGNQKQLTTEEAEQPTVSPDGSLIAFMSGRAGVSHIFLMDAAGGNVRQLTNRSGEYGPTFSPDGRWVLHASRETGKLETWRVPVEGGEPQQVTDMRLFVYQVSPDGKWLAADYREDQPGALDKAAIISSDGSAPVRIFDIPVAGLQQELRWTPDSRALIYIDTRGGVSNLWQQPVEGGEPKQLTDFQSGTIFSFDFSRDARQLALSRGTVTDDVVLIKDFR